MLRQEILKTCLLIFVSLLLFNCRKIATPTEMDMSEYGWVLFDQGSYKKSNQWFFEAVFEDTSYKDGYNGLGWTYGKIGELDSSISNFKLGRRRGLQDTTDRDYNLLFSGETPPHNPVKECTAGLAFAYHAKNDHKSAISYSDTLLNSVGDSSYTKFTGTPGWKFSRDVTISSIQVIWVLASSYFAQGNFQESLTQVKRLVDPPFEPDLTTVEGVAELAEKIEWLRNNPPAP
jgi:tetratricopeptide (TPR) repeat protein|tara:strand:- start:3215 stop:3910 length:696 start_codon:yes stop_codon:yes gene_type:complete